MATKSVTLKDSNGDTLYPVTDSNVVNINQQKTLAQALDGVVYAEDPTQNVTPTAWVTNSDIDWSTVEYSTTEQVVGKWIDGRVVYRKVLAGTTSSGVSERLTHGITNFGTIINVYGYIYGSSNQPQPIQRVVPDGISSYGIGVGDFTSTDFLFQHPAGNYQSKAYAVILEYIKTS